MGDSTVKVKVVLDGSNVRAGVDEVNREVSKIGPAAQASAGQAASAVNFLGESSEQAASRIRNMVSASLASVDAHYSQASAARQAAAAEAEVAASTAQSTAARQAAAASFGSIAAGESEYAAIKKKVQQSFASEAQTISDVTARRALYGQALKANVLTEAEYESALKELDKAQKGIIVNEQKSVQAALNLVDKYGGAATAIERLAVDEDLLNAALKSGAISAEQHAAAIAGIAAQRAEIQAASSAMSGLTLNTANVRREFSLLTKDIATGDFSRAGREMGTLAGSTGAVRLAFSALGGTIIAGVAVIGTLIGLLISSYREMSQLNDAIISTGNSSGKSAGELIELAEGVARATGEFGKSHEAVLLLARDGKLSGEAFDEAARGVIALSTVTGQSIEKSVEEFSKLSKDPLKGIVEFTDKYHLFTAAIYDQVKALQDQGNATEATELAVSNLSQTMQDREKKMVDTAGSVERAWRAVKGAIAEAAQQVKDFGRTDDQALFNKALDRQNAILAVQSARAGGGGIKQFAAGEAAGLLNPDLLVKTDAQLQKAFLDNQQLLNSINNRINASKKADEEAAKQHALEEAEIHAKAAIDQTLLSLDKQAAKQKAIEQLNANFAALKPGDQRLAGVTAISGADPTKEAAFAGGAYAKLLDEINEKYSDHGKAARDAASADREYTQAMTVLNDIIGKASATLNPLEQAEEKHVETLQKIVKAGGEAYAAGVKLHYNQQQLASIQQTVTKAIDAENEAYDEDVQRIKDKQDVVGQVIQQLDAEIEAHGKSAAAIQAEAFVREAVNRAKAAGKPLSLDEIAYLRNEVTAREAIKQALDYTDKLKQNNEQLKAEIEARGELSPLQKAELEIEKLMPDLLKGDAEGRQKVIDAMRQQAAEQQILQAGASLSNTLSNVFESTAQSIASGSNAWQSFGKAAQSAITPIAKDLSKLIEGLRTADKNTQGFGDAIESLKTDAKNALPAVGQLAGAIIAASGGDRTSSTIGGALSGAITGFQSGGFYGAIIGAIIGGVSGYLSGGSKNPAVYLNAGTPGRHGTAPIQTPLGSISTDTDNLADDAYKAFEQTIRGFDISLAKLFDPQQLQAVQDRLAHFTGKFGDITNLLQARFDAILSTFDSTISDFVNGAAADLQGRVQALADVLSIKKIVDSGTSFVGSLGDALKLITEFGQAGERAVDTYNRLAVSSAQWTTAMGLMGYTMQGTAVDIAEFAAKIAGAGATTQESTTLWDAYFKHFYSQQELNAEQVKELQKKVSDSFAKIGEDPTESMAKFRQDFEAALPTLTPEQIIDWLRAAQALGQYDDAIKASDGNATAATKSVQDYADALKAQHQSYIDSLQGASDYLSTVDALQNELYGAADGTTSFRAAVANVRLWEAQTVDTLNAAARAAGEQGAAESDLALVHQIAAARIAAAMQRLLSETSDLISKLNSYDLNGTVQDTTNQQISAINDVGQAADDMYARQKQSIQSIQDYLDSQLLGDTSSLTPAQKIAEAFRQLKTTQAAALGGDAAAAAKLPQLADAYLRLVQGAEASGADYNSQVSIVRALLQAVVDKGPLASPGGGGGGGITNADLVNNEKQAAADMAEQRKQLALQLAEHLRDLSQQLNVPLEKIIQTEGYSLQKLAKDLGVDLSNITGQSVVALGQLASALGISLGTLTTDLGKNLTDLGGGIKELEANLGIDMNNLTGAQVESLKALGDSLGLSLTDLVTATGNNLSDLASGISDLEKNLGIDFDNLTGAQVESLASLANSLGLSLGDLVAATGNKLTDLAGGVKDLTDSLGIDLNHLTGDTTKKLGDLAGSLGLKIGDLADSLGLDLGNLADKQSLLNQALGETIDNLPDGTKSQLEPLFQAITNATTEADANAAIKNLEDAVTKLPGDQSAQLAPYFSDIFPKQASNDLDFLSDISKYASQTSQSISDAARTLDDIYSYGVSATIANELLKVSVTNFPDGPAYDVGSTYIPSDQTAKIHAGEAVVDAKSNAVLKKYGIKVSSVGGTSDEMVSEVRALREELALLRREAALQSRDEIAAVKTEGATNRAHRITANDDLARKIGSKSRGPTN